MQKRRQEDKKAKKQRDNHIITQANKQTSQQTSKKTRR